MTNFETIALKDVPKGTYFITTKTAKGLDPQTLTPRESSVWVKGDYDRSSKSYSCYKFNDICHEKFFKGKTLVSQDFIF